MKWLKIIGLFGILIAGATSAITPPVVAQPNSCSETVRLALQTAGSVCQTTGRNQACYGNINGAVSLRDPADSAAWVNVGDTSPLTQITRMTLGAMDESNAAVGCLDYAGTGQSTRLAPGTKCDDDFVWGCHA